jgi:hypothetical protein
LEDYFPKFCNGTSLQVKHLSKNTIKVITLTKYAKGETVLIPIIPLIPSDYPFEFKCLQFPIKLCSAMIINKAQGQSLKEVGTDLTEEMFFTQFIHGLLKSWFCKMLTYADTHRKYTKCLYEVLC